MNRRPHPYQPKNEIFLIFLVLYGYIRFTLFSFRHSLDTGISHISPPSVAGSVVKPLRDLTFAICPFAQIWSKCGFLAHRHNWLPGFSASYYGNYFCDGVNNENRWLPLSRTPYYYHLNSMLDVRTSGTPHRYKNSATWLGFWHLGPTIIDFTFNARSSSQYSLGTDSPGRGEGNTFAN